jgi:antitoxin (DNA-binding transcriptional repressor) of toxin-antitoxin stability system
MKGKLEETRTAYALTLDEARLRQAPFTIERDGEPVAAVVPIDEYREFIAWREQAGHRSAVHAREQTPQNEVLTALEKERAHFLRLKDQLLRTHRGKFVAILNGEVIDVDEDGKALTRRVYAEYGYVPIYIDRVVEERPVRQIPSPKKVR